MTLTYIYHSGYTLGARQFIERFKVGLFVPMHFTTGYESAWRMKEFTDEKGILFWEISREGDVYTIDCLIKRTSRFHPDSFAQDDSALRHDNPGR